VCLIFSGSSVFKMFILIKGVEVRGDGDEEE